MKDKKESKDDDILFLSDDEIETLCKNHNLDCHITSGGLISITSNVSRWRITHDNFRKIKLYHQNQKYNVNRKNHKKYAEGYHQQKVNANNLLEAIRYIYEHDKWFLKNQNNKKNKFSTNLL